MILDSRQSRRYYLAGTVAFPTPYPSVGTISIEKHTLQFPPDGHERYRKFVVVQELHGPGHGVVRLIRRRQVAALFVPGEEVTPAGGGPAVFQFADPTKRIHLEKGKWFLTPDIKPGTLAAALSIDETERVRERTSPVRGIVFVRENVPVIVQHEVGQSAAEAAEYSMVPKCQDERSRGMYCQCE